ncbi:MAG: hypothetical protein JWO67_3144 [Streptosporangiaceae bacterium]|nr:hypothetical protein [Streptosporangiaceae bacterium]
MTDAPRPEATVLTAELLHRAIDMMHDAPKRPSGPIYLPPGATLDDLLDALRAKPEATP